MVRESAGGGLVSPEVGENCLYTGAPRVNACEIWISLPPARVSPQLMSGLGVWLERPMSGIL